MAIVVEIPENRSYIFKHLVLDFNGTLAIDGKMKPDVASLLLLMAKQLKVHILTADTFGTVYETMRSLPVTLSVLDKKQQSVAKGEYVSRLGANHVVAVGNGNNDRMMLQKAALGIAVIMEEGAATQTVLASDMVCRSIDDALRMLLHPKRIVAGLR